MNRILNHLLFLMMALSATLFGTALENEDGSPSCELLLTLAAAHIPHDGTWESIVSETQKRLRAPQHELWEIDPSETLSPERAYLLFKKLGMLDQISPKEKHYSVVLINGSSLGEIRSRLLYLKELWEEGMRFDHLVLLGGERHYDHLHEQQKELLSLPPYPIEDGWKLPEKLPKTEYELFKFVYEQMKLPQEMRELPVRFVNAKRPPHRLGPSHIDTLKEWQKEYCVSDKENYLFISSQPFVFPQEVSERNFLPAGTQIETVGRGLSKEVFDSYKNGPEILLDTLYRWIYEVKCGPSAN